MRRHVGNDQNSTFHNYHCCFTTIIGAIMCKILFAEIKHNRIITLIAYVLVRTVSVLPLDLPSRSQCTYRYVGIVSDANVGWLCRRLSDEIKTR